ncbi:IclR family transcriptional regulator [Microbacterium sp. DT81.1]|uniref:IclR family transcriptional regulator n=1 Tax=Microbacterium sp. DT81.1 TaxID=3393413 RepID=UPI003CF898AE
MRTADWTESVSVLDRITAVFEAFGEDDEGLGVSELARRANLPKSTVSRIANDLVGQRLLDREGDKLYLGVHLFEMGQTVEQPRRLRHFALPVMTELRNLTGQTVHLAVLEGTDVVFLSVVRGRPTQAPVARVGTRLPASATALGKAMLAFTPPEVAERIVNADLRRLASRTTGDASALLLELADARRSGFASEREESAAGRCCIASAILGSGTVPVAAISVTGTSEELDPGRAAPAVRAAAMTLTRRLDAGRGGAGRVP